MKSIIVLSVFALLILFTNFVYCIVAYSQNGGFVPVLFKQRDIDQDKFVRRRLYGIECWISFLSFFIILFLAIRFCSSRKQN